MGDWKPKLKSYSHFDEPISSRDAELLATDPKRVSRHTFYPFIRVFQRWNRFAEKGQVADKKERPIRYAARADAYIFSYYRHLLASPYEDELERLKLSDSVIAYRRIAKAKGAGGKCNIDHMLDATNRIRALGDCFVIALDISSFFENLDHDRLKTLWCRLLGVSRLPDDHFKVFQAITSYSIVEREEVLERLGYYGVKRVSARGVPIKGYLTPAKNIPIQLCRGAEFREKIAGGSGLPSLIKKHLKNYGVPQGSPISDLLANMYLIDFDVEVLERVERLGGTYLRYSDDILMIVPTDEASAIKLELDVRNSINKFGKKLKIKEEKSSIVSFKVDGTRQSCRRIMGAKGGKGIEYLGFRYDGNAIYLRDSTLSNLWRKVAMRARREAIRAAKRYPDKSAVEIVKLFDIERCITRFGRGEDFKEKSDDY
ncbi:MAG: reverse transcriptase/maturase family protein, partial [Beijerinckiaceae bacterium]